MKIACLGDIHANLPALESVLADIHRRGIRTIWNAGDSVGYGPFPNEVIRRLTQARVVSIAGNYDLKVLASGAAGPAAPQPRRQEKKLAFQWAYRRLSPRYRAWLAALPQERRRTIHGKRILLTHGSPDSNSEYVSADTPLPRLRQLARTAGADIIICGHAHRPFAQKINQVWFINTGSVGRPDDGDPRACYAVLQLDRRHVRARHYRLAYDVRQSIAAIRRHKLPAIFSRMLELGISLKAAAAADRPHGHQG